MQTNADGAIDEICSVKEILPEEQVLIGNWIFQNGKMIADQICQRIEHLTNHYLNKIAVDKTGWATLYLDPQDKRFWEKNYPQGHMQGGGPPRLQMITRDEAKKVR